MLRLFFQSYYQVYNSATSTLRQLASAHQQQAVVSTLYDGCTFSGSGSGIPLQYDGRCVILSLLVLFLLCCWPEDICLGGKARSLVSVFLVGKILRIKRAPYLSVASTAAAVVFILILIVLLRANANF